VSHALVERDEALAQRTNVSVRRRLHRVQSHRNSDVLRSSFAPPLCRARVVLTSSHVARIEAERDVANALLDALLRRGKPVALRLNRSDPCRCRFLCLAKRVEASRLGARRLGARGALLCELRLEGGDAGGEG
jgi:hypothetical protein